MEFQFEIKVRTSDGEKWVDGRKVFNYLNSLKSGVKKPHSKEKEELFNKWWNLYSHKYDRKNCEKAFLKISIKNIEKIMEHTKKYVKNTHVDGTYPGRKHPKTYLNKEAWKDDIVYIQEDQKIVAQTSAAEKQNEYTKKQFRKTLKMSGNRSDEEIDKIVEKYHQE